MSKKPVRLLALDDDPVILDLFGETFTGAAYDFQPHGNADAALQALGERECDVVLLDLNMPDRDGIDVLREIRKRDIPVEVIVLTGHGTVSAAVDAMKLGASDFLTKPINLEELRVTVDRAWRQKHLARENLLLREEVRRHKADNRIITRSPVMEKVLATVGKVAASDYPVLVTGETGVGKELVAAHIHALSARAEKSFVPINCGSLPETMLESELFGYEKGAFTGAASRKPGLFEIADEGTIFLDEIGEMPMALQGKLLRALESGRFFRLGGTQEIQVDVRFISATNRDLEKAIGDGSFRRDLFFRISALPVAVPPLRARREDIALLVDHFHRSDPSLRGREISKEAVAALEQHDWPGNVRELQNTVHRLLLLGEEAASLPGAGQGEAGAPRDETNLRLADVERAHILRVMDKMQGQRKRTAEALGIDPKTLYRKLKEYGFDA